MKNTFHTLLLALLLPLFSMAQQVPKFTLGSPYQHLLNPGTDQMDDLVFGLDLTQYAGIAVRTQWTGIADSPLTGIARYDRRFAREKMLAGISLLTDRTGPTSTQGGYLRYAYQMKMGDGTLSVGLAAGFLQNRFDAHESYLRDANDAVGLESTSDMYVDFSFGAFYAAELGYGDLIYFGASVPQITGIDIGQASGEDAIIYRRRHYHASAGYMKFMSAFSGDSDLSYLEPRMSLTYTEGAPMQVTAGLRFQLEGVIWAGLGHAFSFAPGQYSADEMRFEAGVILGAQGNAEQVLKIGYAASKSMTPYNVQLGGAHELNLTFGF